MSAERTLPIKANAALAALHISVNIFQFLVLPLWLLPADLRWAWLLVPLALLNNPFWSLIHEAIHDLFHPSSRVNRLFGRMAAILFGAPFRVLRLSHLLHHQLNRTPREATEVFDPAHCSRFRAAGGYFFQILGGLYLIEFLSAFLFLLPRRWIRAFNARYLEPQSVSAMLMKNWTTEEAIREIRTDGMLVLGWFGLSLWAYGDHWPLLAGALGARAFLISFLDNVYHYGTPVNDIFYASNLHLPSPAGALLLHFNLHGVHHQHPAASWSRLPALFRERSECYQGSYFGAAARQLKGPLAIESVGLKSSSRSNG